MGKITRRDFLGLSAATAGAAAISKLPFALRTAWATAPAGNSVFAIRHVVVLMQENRSFDHYFGAMRGVRGLDDRAALRLNSGHVLAQWCGPGTRARPVRGAATTCIADLDHSWPGTHHAWNRGNYDRWAEAKGAAAMTYLDRAAIPFHYALADAFTVCDHYFCSVMGPTNPNRLYLWSGTNDPNGLAGGPVIDNAATDFRWTTYPERLQAAGVSWKIYQNAHDNYDDNALAWFRRFREARPGSPLHDRGMASVPARTGDTGADIVAAIEADVRAGTLPVVSWIVAPERCSEHPRHTPAAGAEFIARVLAALTADPSVWASTALLINYDENDGFFDHVPPPVPAPGTPDEFIHGEPIGFGPRVPMLVVSPWSRGGFVCSQVFDHTSVIRLLEILTGVAEPNISRWRRQVSGDLTAAFDFTATQVAMPALPVPGETAVARTCAAAAGATRLQEAGDRPARALPYQPNAVATVNPAGVLDLVLSNAGAQSVHLAVYVEGEHAPRQCDVPGANGVAEIAIEAGADYDVHVHGPNGFARRYAGSAASRGIEAGMSFAVDGAPVLRLTLTNASAAAATLRVCGDAYADDAPRAVRLEPGEHRVIERAAFRTNGWYDVSVTADVDPAFLRRCSGHLETGAASVSG